MRRRLAVTRLVLGIAGALSSLVSCAVRPRSSEGSVAGRLLDDEARLRADLGALEKPGYSDPGVAVFLIGENLASETYAVGAARVEGRRLSKRFRKLTDVFLRIRPEAAKADVPKLIEALAYDDFGKEPR